MNKVFFGDCRDSMRQMARDGIKVQTCITSPPYYGLRDYGHDGQIGNEETPKEFINNLVEVFSCVWDVLTDDGTLWVNLGDSYARVGGDSSKQGRHWDNRKNNPTTGHNRYAKDMGVKEKNLLGMPWRLAFALQEFGWYLRQDIIWHKPNPMPESVKDRCTKSHEYIFLLSKKPYYYFDNQAIQENANYPNDDRGSRCDSRRGTECNSMSGKTGETRNKRDVWSVPTKPYLGAHFAVYPEELVQPMVLAGSRVGDIVLDPFFGSGTTGAVAQSLGRKWIGCELNRDYEALQNERLAQQAFEI